MVDCFRNCFEEKEKFCNQVYYEAAGGDGASVQLSAFIIDDVYEFGIFNLFQGRSASF